MKISRKFKPLFDLPKAWGEIERLSFSGLSEEEQDELHTLIELVESEDVEQSVTDRIKELRYKKLSTEQCEKLDYWLLLGGVSIVSITGGRESSKTFTASLAGADRVVNYGYRELYTRYTMKSASKSVIPAFLNRAKILGYTSFLKSTLTSVICLASGGYVDFSGIKASSGNQSANLKSLEDYCVFTVEEGEEFPTYEEWEKIELSFRSKDVQPFSVFIMNPTTKKFWWFEKMFRQRGVKEGFNGIKGNVLYIHTTYLDLGKKHVARKNWIKYEEARIVYERLEALTDSQRQACSANDIRLWKYYKYTVLGGWKETEEGIIYDIWETFDEFPDDKPKLRIFGLDFGFTKDPSALVECRIYEEDIYAKEHIYASGLMNEDLASAINNAVGKEKAYVVADSARPDKIAELNKIVAQKRYNFVVLPCVKGQGSVKDGIEKVKSKNLHLHKDSTNLHDEANHYHTITITNTKGETVYHIVDANNHACFVGDTMITTINGDKPIRDITTNDKVLTSDGWKNVLNRWDNGVKETYEYWIQLKGQVVKLQCTPDHKVKTTDGWIEVSKIHHGLKVYLNGDKNAQKVVYFYASPRKRTEQVYDLHVEDCHEYFANGLLVHNCDALRYAVTRYKV